MTVSRSWTLIDESKEVSEQDQLVCDTLAREWSELQSQAEAESFRRQAEREDGDDPADHFETDAELHDWERREAARIRVRDVKISTIESALEMLGARMMRPYEHWNEDERLMEYMERER